MEYRRLGNTALEVSAISLGCEGFVGKGAEEVATELDYALAKGINFMDIYSSNPELRTNIGKALWGWRDRFIIQGHLCTAWENGQYLRTRDVQKTKLFFEDLLKRLQTDYIDVGMIHYVDDEKDFHHVFDGEIIQLAEQLKGKDAYAISV